MDETVLDQALALTRTPAALPFLGGKTGLWTTAARFYVWRRVWAPAVLITGLFSSIVGGAVHLGNAYVEHQFHDEAQHALADAQALRQAPGTVTNLTAVLAAWPGLTGAAQTAQATQAQALTALTADTADGAIADRTELARVQTAIQQAREATTALRQVVAEGGQLQALQQQARALKAPNTAAWPALAGAWTERQAALTAALAQGNAAQA